MKRLLIIISLILVSLLTYSQDNRTLETKVADLLARMPVNNNTELSRQMNQFLDMGKEGRTVILSMLTDPGTGDDTRARFVIESYSHFLSSYEYITNRTDWEIECISAINTATNIEVKSFLMKQLNYIGGNRSVKFAANYLSDKDLCEPAVAVLASVHSKPAEEILAESLCNTESPCAAGIMNVLANRKSDIAVDEYINWYKKGDNSVKTSALNAMAESASEKVYKILSEAASENNYQWESTGATTSLIQYARNIGEKGEVASLEKICRKIIKKGSVNYKISALEALINCRGYEAMQYLISAFENGNKEFRMAALLLSGEITDKAATQKWIKLFYNVDDIRKAEIIEMLGRRGDNTALPVIKKSLFSPSVNIRVSSAHAVTNLLSTDAVPYLIDYITSFETEKDQEAAYNALSIVVDSRRRDLIAGALKGSGEITRCSLIRLLGNGGENRFFDTVFKYTKSDNSNLRLVACTALTKLVKSTNQDQLLDLLAETDNKEEIRQIQIALSVAANQTAGKEQRAKTLLTALNIPGMKEKIIPVLAEVGGNKALNAVLYEFEQGDQDKRQIAYLALTNWVDYKASYVLYDICASGNKTYSEKAFNGYIKQISKSTVSDDQKLLLYRKIMSYAFTVERKNSILKELGNVHTFLSFIFTASYLENKEVQQAAARSLMLIALPQQESTTGLYGEIVRKKLNRVIEVLEGEESQYDKENIRKYIESMPDDPGFVSMFNGKDLSGWQGLVEDPVARSKMSKKELAKKQKEADKKMYENWSVKDGAIWFSGHGANLCSVKKYGDFELYADWRITKNGDSGIYLRGTPQVQIWDTSRVEAGAQVGSGGLYNNQKYMSKPLKVADNPIGDWNTFRIVMTGERVSVWLNGELVVNNVVMENYWDRSQPIFPTETIELQAHGNELAFRNIYVKEIKPDEYNLTAKEKAEEFVALFNGSNLDNWIGNKESYVVEDGQIVIKPNKGSGGNIYTEKEYSDFIYRFEFLLTPGANNGLCIRAPLKGDAAYVGMELQILDNSADIYANLQPYQYHGSVYGVIPAKRGFLRPVGEWNKEEVIVKGTHIMVILNDEIIVDGDIADARENGSMDHRNHPGLKQNTGHIGFLGHGSIVKFRNIRIKDLSKGI